jgi:hypothetical protein
MTRDKLRFALLGGALALMATCGACGAGGGGGSGSVQLVTISGTSVEGADNDVIVAVFAVEMDEGAIETHANWNLEAPVGTPFDITGATIDYVPGTATVTVTLVTGTVGTVANGNNLQTSDGLKVTFLSIDTAAAGEVSGAATGVTAGDDEAPVILGAFANGVATTADIRFSEACNEILFGELFSGLPGDPGPRFVLTDANATPGVAATGTVTLTGQPGDADTVTIDDDTQTVVFEFDSDVSVINTPTLRGVTIGVNSNATTANLAIAINDAGFTFDVAALAVASVCNLTHDIPGTAGNNAVVEAAANVAAAGLAGGVDPVPAAVNPFGPGFAWATDSEGLVVDYTPTVPALGSDTIQVYGLRDLAGNWAFVLPALPVTAVDATVPALSVGNSNVTVVTGEQNDTILVKFNTPMSGSNILAPANYTAAPLDLSGGAFTFDGVDEVTIQMTGAVAANALFGTGYPLTLVQNVETPLVSAQGVALPANDVDNTVGSGENTAMTGPGTSAYEGDPGNPATCVVVFPEAADPIGAATTGNYDILGAPPIVVTALTPRAFRLRFAVAPVATDVLNISAAAATDLGGTPAVAALAVALVAVDATPPTATVVASAVANRGGDALTIDFDEPVALAGALTLSNYAVTQGGQPVDLTGASIRYDSTTQSVVIALPDTVDWTFGANVVVTVSNVNDLSGNALVAQPAAVPVAGDNVAPGFFGASSAFVNWAVDASGQTVDVLFSEDVDATFVELPGNWTGSSATPISAVSLIAPNVARVTTVGQVVISETLQVTGLPDLAGNTSGAIAVNPFE